MVLVNYFSKLFWHTIHVSLSLYVSRFDFAAISCRAIIIFFFYRNSLLICLCFWVTPLGLHVSCLWIGWMWLWTSQRRVIYNLLLTRNNAGVSVIHSCVVYLTAVLSAWRVLFSTGHLYFLCVILRWACLIETKVVRLGSLLENYLLAQCDTSDLFLVAF